MIMAKRKESDVRSQGHWPLTNQIYSVFLQTKWTFLPHYCCFALGTPEISETWLGTHTDKEKKKKRSESTRQHSSEHLQYSIWPSKNSKIACTHLRCPYKYHSWLCFIKLVWQAGYLVQVFRIMFKGVKLDFGSDSAKRLQDLQ